MVGRGNETQLRWHFNCALFPRPWVVLRSSLWYVAWKQMSQLFGLAGNKCLKKKQKHKTPLVLLIHLQISAHPTGTFFHIPTVAASASHLSTLRKKVWRISILSPSSSQSLMTNTPSNTSSTLAIQVRHSFDINGLIVNVKYWLVRAPITFTAIVCWMNEQIIASQPKKKSQPYFIVDVQFHFYCHSEKIKDDFECENFYSILCLQWSAFWSQTPWRSQVVVWDTFTPPYSFISTGVLTTQTAQSTPWIYTDILWRWK